MNWPGAQHDLIGAAHLVVLDRDGYVRRSVRKSLDGAGLLVDPRLGYLPKRGPPREAAESTAQQSTPLPYRILEEAARPGSPIGGECRRQFIGGEGWAGGQFGRDWRLCILGEIGWRLSIHNCLFYRIALRNRKVCQIDTALLREMLGVDIQRRDCLLDGAGKCSFFVPDSES